MSSERFSLDRPDWPEFLFHMQRYALASRFALNKSVLDCACGEGYGSAYIARSASRVVGVDVSEVAIEICRKKYDLPNCSYQVGDITKLEFPDMSFDVIASFETFEHLDEAQQSVALADLSRVLKPGGVLLISTPDREVGRARKYANPFHLHELSTEEFRRELKKRFSNVVLYSQELNMSSSLWPLEERLGKSLGAWVDQVEVSPSGEVAQRNGNISNYYVVAICSNARLAAPAVHSFMSRKREPAEVLWSRIDKLASDVMTLENERDRSSSQSQSAPITALVEAREMLENLSSAFIERFARLEQLNAHLEADRAFHLLETRAEKLAMRLAGAEDERNAAQAQQRELMSDAAALREQLAEALSTLDLQKRTHVAEGDIQRREIALLRERLEATERNCEELRVDLAAQTEVLATAQFELGLSREQLSISERNCEQLRVDVAAQTEALSTGHFELELSREQLSISERNCEQLRVDVAAQTEALSTAQFELELSREQLSVSERNGEQLRVDLAAQTEVLVTAQFELRLSREQLSISERNCEQFRVDAAALSAMRSEVSRLSEQAAAMAVKYWHARVWQKALQATLGAPDATMFKATRINQFLRSKLGFTRLDYHIIRFSGLLSPDWYLTKYPDVRDSGMDPFEHYLLHGVEEMRETGPIFNAQSYLMKNTDVQIAKVNPIVHFIKYGFEEGRWKPSALEIEMLSSASDQRN